MEPTAEQKQEHADRDVDPMVRLGWRLDDLEEHLQLQARREHHGTLLLLGFALGFALAMHLAA